MSKNIYDSALQYGLYGMLEGTESGNGSIAWYMEYEALGPASIVTAAPTD